MYSGKYDAPYICILNSTVVVRVFIRILGFGVSADSPSFPHFKKFPCVNNVITEKAYCSYACHSAACV